MKPKDIKLMKWYKIKNNIFYPNFYAQKIHKPKSIDKKINKFMVEGVHVSSHIQCLDFGLIKYIPASDLIKTDQPSPTDHRAASGDVANQMPDDTRSGASGCSTAGE